MRHRKKSEKFSRSRAQRKALIRSLLRAIVIYERITTTESKAKALRGWVDKLITLGKEGDLSARREVYRFLNDHRLVKRLFDEIAPRFAGINGGYTRVIDVRFRKGDGAKLAILELTRREEKILKKVGKKGKEAPKEPKVKVEVEEKVEVEKERPDQKGFLSGLKKFFKKK